MASDVQLDEAAVERASRGIKLQLPRGPHRGKLGEVRASSAGSSMEIHDFRQYLPGDDLRQIDWNAVARTGELILRVRQDEVAPRVELVVDGSKSMAITAQKAARVRELSLLVTRVAARQGLEPTLIVAAARAERGSAATAAGTLRATTFDGRDDLASALRRSPPTRPCGLRLVISDFLFEAELERFIERLARGAAGLVLLQLLDPEDLSPTGGFGAQLVDVESEQALERILSAQVLRAYQQRLDAHQRLLRAAAARVHATLVTLSAGLTLEALVRGPLSHVMAGGAAELRASGSPR